MTEATPETFDRLVAQDDALVVAYFWGHDCPNCDVFKADLPVLLPQVPEGVRFLSVNAYEHMDLAKRFGLYGIPAFLLFFRGKLLGKMSQYNGKQYWVTVVREQLERTRKMAEENPLDRQNP